MQDEHSLRQRAESAEATNLTIKQSLDAIKERYQNFKTNFGVREKSSGEIVIDFEKMVDHLGLEGCIELRGIIDKRYLISGEPGEKPHVKLAVAE